MQKYTQAQIDAAKVRLDEWTGAALAPTATPFELRLKGFTCRGIGDLDVAKKYAADVANFFQQHGLMQDVFVVRGPTSTTSKQYEVVEASCGYTIVHTVKANVPAAARDNDGGKVQLYILPGASRKLDRVVPAAILKIENYSPSKDAGLPEIEREYRPDMLRVTVRGEERKDYPFILPCDFRLEWKNLETAAEWMGLKLMVGEPVKDEDEIGRSVIRSWFATADGAVYTARRHGGSDKLIAEKLPIGLDAVWIASQVQAPAPSPVPVRRMRP